MAAPEIIDHEGQHYIAALMPELDGIRIARLVWVPAESTLSDPGGPRARARE